MADPNARQNPPTPPTPWRAEPDPLGLPRWYLWEGGFFAIGKGGGEVPPHSHHAIQVYIALDGHAAIRPAGGDWVSGRGMIVRPDIEHAFDPRGSQGAMLLIDPESGEGRWLRTALTSDITVVPDARLETCVKELRAFNERPLEGLSVGDLVQHCVRALCAGAPPLRKLDERVSVVLKAIRDADDLRLTLESAAALVHLSPGRFAHLFTQQMGLPFRRYMLWRKLARAVVAIGREGNLAAAAQASDFSDAAHLTRTFHQMFGIPPSVMMRGQFFEIESPFGLPE